MIEANTGAPDRKELSLRGLALGAAITLIFTAANVFLGLKAGLTFATSIPAAVISMAILRGFTGSTIQENNIVQTVASAAGTLSAIIFVLPGLVMIGWWTGFPYWTSFSICALGGVLGVMYSIPLRRALVTNSDLPYPEGVACAEVLKVGGHGGGTAETLAASREGLFAIIIGSLSSALFAVIVATQVFASDVEKYFRVGGKNAVSGFDFSLSFALFAVGHLVGLWTGIAMLAGAMIAWAAAVPFFSNLQPFAGTVAEFAHAVWSHQVRFVGAGVIGIAAIWSLIKLVGPVVGGLRSAIAASRVRRAGQGASLPRTEQDIPIGIVSIITLLCMLPIAALLAHFGAASGLGDQLALLVAGGVVYIALLSFFVASVCGYMAGLIGASNSPLSGVGILVVLGASLLLAAGVKPLMPPAAGAALVAYALFVTAVVFCAATISNDNLQDLKTGQLVDATPWRQQLALIVGVAAGAAIIPPVLDLLNHAYGFAGAPGVDASRALAAPQAALISALAQGVIQGNLDWSLIGSGVIVGVGLIVLDEILRRSTAAHLPPLAVGLGIYLPTSTTLMIVVGAVVGWAFDRRAERAADPAGTRQLGVLLASGMIVGESLVGVLLAAVVVFSGSSAPLALVGDAFASDAIWVGAIAFAVSIAALYGWLNRLSAAISHAPAS
jgi:putative OPT family oligopeptide transporter